MAGPLVRRGCLRSSGGTEPSAALGTDALAKARGQEPFGFRPANWLSPSFSQITSTVLVEVDEVVLCEETQSREKTEEDDEEAEEDIEEA